VQRRKVSMHLILARHGNTFASDDRVYWIGVREDLPLVASGVEQAERFAQALCSVRSRIHAVYSGSLRRTRDYAQPLLRTLNISLQIDPRLNELDYGLWAGLTTEEIRQRWGDALFDAWEHDRQWPQGCAWADSETEIRRQVSSFAQEILHKYPSDAIVVLITSHGRLRYFLDLLPNALHNLKNFKVATGNVCHFNYQNDQWYLVGWNRTPDQAIASAFSLG